MKRLIASLVAALFLAGLVPTMAMAGETVAIRLGAFWVMSGIFKSFGVNSKAVYKAYVDELHAKGGVKLKDGRIGRIETTFYDTACNAEQGIAITRKMATRDKVLLAVGPVCSSVLEPIFGTLQKKLDDPSDTGLQFMVFSDTSIKTGLGKISAWGFRASPDENAMYLDVMKHLKALGYKTIAFGYEDDFAHSTATYKKVMRPHAKKVGLEVVSDQAWHFTDTEFSTQARKIRAAKADVLALSSHPFTTCGFMREAKRQRIRYKLLLGLTSSSSIETLQGCAREVEGVIIPTAFAPVNPEAVRIAKLVNKYGGFMDIHSAAVWEVMDALVQAFENVELGLKPETLQSDRRKIRDYVAKIGKWQGLLGTIISKNNEPQSHDGDVSKPWLLAEAQGSKWGIYWRPKVLGGKGPLKGAE